MIEQPDRQHFRSGLFYSILAYFIWGIFPLYWKMLTRVPAEQILAHRIVWSFILLSLVILITREKHFLEYLRNPKIMGILFTSGVLIALNWGTYIYAVNNDQIVEASLGYYINPVVNVILGLIFLKERLSRLQGLALFFGLAGLTYLTFNVGKIPLISLVLAVTFGLYALLRKQASLRSMPALTIETMVITPIALYYLWHVDQAGTGAFLHQGWKLDILLILAGPVTAIPLFLFGMAAPRVPLSTLGFIQYLSPSIQLLIGILIFHEKFNHVDLISFSLVWVGLGIYTFSILRQLKKNSAR